MVVIKSVNVKSINDSRKEKTILVKIKTDFGIFSASAPTGKSTGKNEIKPYKKSLEQDIKSLTALSDYFSEEILEKFEDLRRIEDITDGSIGGNTLFALESAVLKALAKEHKKEIWELIDSSKSSSKMPRLVANVIGGGAHSKSLKSVAGKPDFQEFEIIPQEKTVKESYEKIKSVKKSLALDLKNEDKKFTEKKNDENA